ncbi:PaaI family thioesterase [Xinfangfangia pollutisoli]|uniref:PaaI family thioesterase n=1 Tax=Xinfangfangia pollutisoli TaxID=2865960 RepID=UPI001CD6AD4E|nr:PaaI family thioesterase [Xinfangfangia pollutisoli]
MADQGQGDGGIHPVARNQPPFAQFLGLRLLSAHPDRVEAEMPVVPELINRNGVLHGGAIMGIADNVGGTGAFMNLAEGEGTTTVESKTNFLRAVPAGDLLRAVAVPLHIGRKTQIWQTTLYRGDGKVAAIVTQTQLTLRAGDR